MIRRFACLGAALVLVVSGASAAQAGVLEFDLGTDVGVYTTERGYGFDLGTTPGGGQPFYFSVLLPEGTWRVRVTLGAADHAGETTIKAESRRLMLDSVRTAPGEQVERSFLVHVRTPALPPPPENAPGGAVVRLNDREAGVLHWDDKLTLEVNGPAPAVTRVKIEPVVEPFTVHLAGDSTVTDQPAEPAASWGQMLPLMLGSDIAVANHAESGETLKSFLTGLRLDKLLSGVRPGDLVVMQFGHNDSKRQWPQTYVEPGSTYDAYLRVYIAEVRRRGATPVLVTSVHRRSFDDAGRIINTHGEYPAAVRRVAASEGVPLIDLTAMSARFYEALGPQRAPLAFNAEGRDATHHNNYGAYQLARAVTAELCNAVPEVRRRVAEKFRSYDPGKPDGPETFRLPASPARSAVIPRGN